MNLFQNMLEFSAVPNEMLHNFNDFQDRTYKEKLPCVQRKQLFNY